MTTEEEERRYEEEHILTVGRLIEFLKGFDPKALVCYLELNSDAWISQSPENLPFLVRTVSEEKESMRSDRRRLYSSDAEMEKDMKTLFRYVRDGDVLIRF